MNVNGLLNNDSEPHKAPMQFPPSPPLTAQHRSPHSPILDQDSVMQTEHDAESAMLAERLNQKAHVPAVGELEQEESAGLPQIPTAGIEAATQGAPDPIPERPAAPEPAQMHGLMANGTTDGTPGTASDLDGVSSGPAEAADAGPSGLQQPPMSMDIDQPLDVASSAPSQSREQFMPDAAPAVNPAYSSRSSFPSSAPHGLPTPVSALPADLVSSSRMPELSRADSATSTSVAAPASPQASMSSISMAAPSQQQVHPSASSSLSFADPTPSPSLQQSMQTPYAASPSQMSTSFQQTSPDMQSSLPSDAQQQTMSFQQPPEQSYMSQQSYQQPQSFQPQQSYQQAPYQQAQAFQSPSAFQQQSYPSLPSPQDGMQQQQSFSAAMQQQPQQQQYQQSLQYQPSQDATMQNGYSEVQQHQQPPQQQQPVAEVPRTNYPPEPYPDISKPALQEAFVETPSTSMQPSFQSQYGQQPQYVSHMEDGSLMSPNGVKRTYEDNGQDGPAKRFKPEDSLPPAPAPRIARPTHLPANQLKYAKSVLNQLKKNPNSPPFLVPVDPIALGIPNYPNIITSPMDIGTIERKLLAGTYTIIEDFIADLRLVFANCYRFNGVEAGISKMAQVLEGILEKQLTKMPPAPSELKALHVTSHTRSVDHSPVSARPRKHSGRKDSAVADRPKRETHAPHVYEPPDLPIAPPKKQRKSMSTVQDSEMRFCREVLRELTKKSNAAFNWVFLEPVDYVKLNLPDYPRIIRYPMDLGTMRHRLESGEYRDSEAFYDDFKLLIKNCYTYNPPGSDVARMGTELDTVFERKWRDKPDPYGSGSDAGSGSDDQIGAMERQLDMMRNNLKRMKDEKRKHREPREPREPRSAREYHPEPEEYYEPRPAKVRAPPAPRPPKPPKAPKAPRASNGGGYKAPKPPRRTSTSGSTAASKKRAARANSSDYDDYGGVGEEAVITFDMKKELANGIGMFEGDKLEKAIDIIRRSRPDLLGDESKEIELDIDMLDPRTLLKLYNFVVAPKGKQKHARPETLTASGQKAHKGGRAGTGGLKGKSLDEDEESARIQALQAKLDSLKEGKGMDPTVPAVGGTGMRSDSDASDSSSSDSDSD